MSVYEFYVTMDELVSTVKTMEDLGIEKFSIVTVDISIDETFYKITCECTDEMYEELVAEIDDVA